MVVYNSNPAAIAPNQNLVLKGMRRDDLFTVVLEQFQTDTADHADILLPVTTFLEHTDLYLAYGHYYLQLARPALPAPGETKSNVEIFRLLAERMGFEDPCFQDTEDDMIRDAAQFRPSFRERNHSRATGSRAFGPAERLAPRTTLPAVRSGRVRHALRQMRIPCRGVGLSTAHGVASGRSGIAIEIIRWK